MFLPIGDQPNPRGFVPFVNYLLIAANVLVFLLVSLPLIGQPVNPQSSGLLEYMQELVRNHPEVDISSLAFALRGVSAYDLFLLKWGYRPGAPSLLTILTSMFLHASWMHLIGNMLFLWIFGDNVEKRLGRLGYLLAYLATGALGTLSFALFVPASAAQVPLVGASGAISGVLGFYFIWFPRNKVRVLVFLFPFFIDVIPIGARWVLGFYLLIDNLLPFVLQGGRGGGVAHGAHIGGFAAGMLAALVIERVPLLLGARRARRMPAAGDEDAPPSSVAVEDSAAAAQTVLALLDYGRPADAIGTYLELSPAARRQVPAATTAALGDWLAAHGEHDGALALYRRGLGAHPQGPGVDRLLLGLGLVLLEGKQRPTAAYQYLLDVLDAQPSAEVEAQARQALATIDRMQKTRIGGRSA